MEISSDRPTACTPGSTRSCMISSIAGAENSAPTGRSVTLATTWKKDITPAGTGTAPAVTILPRKNGSRLESKICCRYRITIVSLPCRMNSTPSANITADSCMTCCLKNHHKHCWISDTTPNVWAPP